MINCKESNETYTDLHFIYEFFELLMSIAEKDGVMPLNKLPGLWVRQLDKHWTIVANGHHQGLDYNGFNVPPFHVYVEFNGFPAGLISPSGATIAAGKAANTKTLLDALKRLVKEGFN